MVEHQSIAWPSVWTMQFMCSCVVVFTFSITASTPQPSSTLPSFLRRRQLQLAETRKAKRPRKEHARTWDKNIVCLPSDYATKSGLIQILRKKKRAILGHVGLIGKIHLTSEMIEEDIFAEVRSVFSKPMRNNPNFQFRFLQSTGGGCKTLSIPSISTHFQWTATQVASLAGQGAIYILADEDLYLPVSSSKSVAKLCLISY